MCIAAPGRVTEINGGMATVDYNGNKVKAGCALADIKIGDWVLVHAGLIIQILPEDEARNMAEIFAELENLK